MPAAARDGQDLRSVRSTTFSPSVGASTSQNLTRSTPPFSDFEHGMAEPSTPTASPATITHEQSVPTPLSKRPPNFNTPPVTRRVSAPIRQLMPNRPSAPVNIPSSQEISASSSVRSARKLEGAADMSPQHVNGHARGRGMTVTPTRPNTLLVIPPSKSYDANGQPEITVAYPPDDLDSDMNAPQGTSDRYANSYAYTNGTSWSSKGSPHSTGSGLPDKALNGVDYGFLHPDPNLIPPSARNSVWDGDGHTVTSFGMETEILEHDDVDEDLITAIDAVQTAHMRRITHYKRLLEKAQTNSASQLHTLQAELKLLRTTLEKERAKSHETELARDRDRLALSMQKKNAQYEGLSPDLASILRGDGNGGFSEGDVRKVIRGLHMSDRMRLISIILDCCLPGDISQQIRLLEKYRRSTFDILTHLPEDIALTILRCLTVSQLLGVETVSKKWQELVHHPALWRRHCLMITATDPIPLRPPANLEEWEPLYRSLHHREFNWKNAIPQRIRFLNGHTKFCTTLLLKGKRLISGSYDETIRVWDIETGEEKKCLQVQKAVSCLDFLAEEEVFAVGFHDIGRVHLYSSVTFNPLQQVQGHLYGIRSVALSPKHLVSAGADKALVAWDWRSGEKIVKFGQQTNQNIGVQILRATSKTADDIGERFVSVTIDGIVRVFSIKRREMISSFNLAHLGTGDPRLSSKIANVGVNANNMLQWFAAEGNQMTCATKSIIIHLEWVEEGDGVQSSAGQSASTLSSPTTSSGPMTPATMASPIVRPKNANPLKSSTGTTGTNGPSQGGGSARRPSINGPRLSLPTISTPRTPNLNASLSKPTRGVPATPKGPASPAVRRNTTSLTAPPRIVAVIETPDIASGAVDPRKRRVVTATRFSQRTGADRRIFISTHKDKALSPSLNEDEEEMEELDANQTPFRPSLSHNRRSSVSTIASNQSGSNATDGASRSRSKSSVDFTTTVDALGGVWAALSSFEEQSLSASTILKTIEGVSGDLPVKFQGLATPAMNPMSFALNHEEVVVGCADGTIYVMNFVGYKYSRMDAFPDAYLSGPVEWIEEYDERTPPASALEPTFDIPAAPSES
ncbi:hypothetical protein FRC17_010736 [Serendipita sp. 399]|nr:hypothetical protein FRC17_010736 [Serendipita sp. 399]